MGAKSAGFNAGNGTSNWLDEQIRNYLWFNQGQGFMLALQRIVQLNGFWNQVNGKRKEGGIKEFSWVFARF